jgi:hypothetical protein
VRWAALAARMASSAHPLDALHVSGQSLEVAFERLDPPGQRELGLTGIVADARSFEREPCIERRDGRFEGAHALFERRRSWTGGLLRETR